MKPIVIICGPPKVGKTGEVFKSFQHSLAILTSEGNPQYYRKQLMTKLKDDPNYKPPKKIKLIDTHSTGVSSDYAWLKPGDAKSKYAKEVNGDLVIEPTGTILMPVDHTSEFRKTVWSVVTKSRQAIDKGEPPPYANVIVDEFGEMLDRIHTESIATTFSEKTGKPDGRGAFMKTSEYATEVVGLLKQLIPCGVGVALVMHDREPEDEKKGGPKGPSAALSRKLVGLVDGAIQRVIRDTVTEDGKPGKPRRIWKAQASEKWDIGLRGLDDDDMEAIEDMSLAQVLELAGYDMS